jgi:threonine dehydratase
VLAHLGLVVEPAGVAGIAALLSAARGTYGERAATILCGGNVTPGMLAGWGVLDPGVGAGDAS